MRQFQAWGYRSPAIDRLQRQLVAALVDHLKGGKPRPPVAGVGLWLVFGALSNLRRWGPNGPDPIQPSEIAAWAEPRGMVLPAHHLDVLAAMDVAWLDHARTPEAERVAGVMTGAQFDAMFG